MNPSKSFQLDHFLAGWIGGEGSNAAIDYLIGLSLMGGSLLQTRLIFPLSFHQSRPAVIYLLRSALDSFSCKNLLDCGDAPP